MTSESAPAYLIVNADDYGYFTCVSRGILTAATDGIVTATGVLANSDRLGEQLDWLRECEHVDTGVHLNLTTGAPLTRDVGRRLVRWGGRFPRKYAMGMAVLSGTVPAADVRAEWRAQIERCLANGLSLLFLNSHEHLHMLPPLFALATELAAEYRIPHLRFTTAGRWPPPLRGSAVRDTVMRVLGTLNRRRATAPKLPFLGGEASGRLDLRSLDASLSHLDSGAVHELMCHPGRFDAQEIRDPFLLRFHDWEGELATLTHPSARELLRSRGIELIGYRHLRTDDGGLQVVH